MGTQSCRVLNEAKKTHHLATPHTLPDCAPKKCPQLTSKLPQNAVGRRGRQHKPGYEASNNLAQATRVKDKRTQSWAWQIAQKYRRGEIREGGQWLQKDCCLCLKDKWASAEVGEGVLPLSKDIINTCCDVQLLTCHASNLCKLRASCPNLPLAPCHMPLQVERECSECIKQLSRKLLQAQQRHTRRMCDYFACYFSSVF